MSILGKPDYRAIMERVIEALQDDEMIGICLACGEEQEERYEPDVRKARCESCGECQVYGAEEILIRGAGS